MICSELPESANCFLSICFSPCASSPSFLFHPPSPQGDSFSSGMKLLTSLSLCVCQTHPKCGAGGTSTRPLLSSLLSSPEGARSLVTRPLPPLSHLLSFGKKITVPEQLASFSEWDSELLAEKATAPHSSTLAWKIPWTEEPGRLQSMGSLRVGHD